MFKRVLKLYKQINCVFCLTVVSILFTTCSYQIHNYEKTRTAVPINRIKNQTPYPNLDLIFSELWNQDQSNCLFKSIKIRLIDQILWHGKINQEQQTLEVEFRLNSRTQRLIEQELVTYPKEDAFNEERIILFALQRIVQRIKVYCTSYLGQE